MNKTPLLFGIRYFTNTSTVEGKVRTVANPTSSARLELILEERLKICTDKVLDEAEDIVTEEMGDDLVTSFFYDDLIDTISCTCSRNSKCANSLCLCKKANKTCGDNCHKTGTSKCAYK